MQRKLPLGSFGVLIRLAVSIELARRAGMESGEGKGRAAYSPSGMSLLILRKMWSYGIHWNLTSNVY